MDFGGVIPDVDIGMSECLLHSDPVLRVDLKHLHQQVSSMFGCRRGSKDGHSTLYSKIIIEITLFCLWSPLAPKSPTQLLLEGYYRTLAKINPPFSARTLGIIGDWAYNHERRVFTRIYAHPRPQIEAY